MSVCQPRATHTHIHIWFLRPHTFVNGMRKKSTREKKSSFPFKPKGRNSRLIIMKIIMLTIWRVRGVCVFGSCVYILIPSCWLSWDRVFLIRRAVSRAALLAYQHSLIIFAITRKACRGERENVRLEDFITTCWNNLTSREIHTSCGLV